MFDQTLQDFDAAAQRFAAAAEALSLDAAIEDAVTPDHFGRLAQALSEVVETFGHAQQLGFRELREALDGE
ncbi:MAG: hypothetical protein ACRDVG_17125 [Jatrophihabitantaceae bacterium]